VFGARREKKSRRRLVLLNAVCSVSVTTDSV
jgi:hypothetical protein